MWLGSFLRIELVVNDRRKAAPPSAPGVPNFVRYWWIHSKAARERLNERRPLR